MANKERYSAQTIIDALRATKGMVYLAADRLDCHPDTVKNYARRYASVAAEVEKQDGIVNDTAELKLIQAIHNGEPWAIKYRLSTKGKDRGYTERNETEHSGMVATAATTLSEWKAHQERARKQAQETLADAQDE